MAYTITLTDGSVFATVADGTINTSSSMNLVGKNYAGYGEFLAENFIHLLENGANTTAPGAPLTGQLWWDKTNNVLKAYNGVTFKTLCSSTASASSPVSNATGDLWYDTVDQQLNVWSGSAWVLVGPAFTPGTGTTGAIVDTIIDNTLVSHVVIKLYVSDSIVGIISKDAAFTPQTPISGYTQVKPGITLASLIGSEVPLFQGTATDSQTLDGLDSTAFMRSNANTSTTGTIAVLTDNGLTVGADSDFKVSVSGINATIQNQTSSGNLDFKLNVSGVPTTILTLNSSGATLANALAASSGGTGITSVGTSGNVLTSTGSAWVSSAPAVPNLVVASGYNFAGRTNSVTPNSKVDFTASELVLKSASASYLATSVSVTADITVSGANGLDTGVEASSTWYYIWVIYNGTTVASLLSTSSTAPTLPGGYTYKALVGAVYNDGSSNFVPYRQSGTWVDYNTIRNLITGGTATIETVVSTANAVPSVAKQVKFSTSSFVTANASGAATSTANFAVVSGGTTAQNYMQAAISQTAYDASQFQAQNISQNIYYVNVTGGGVANAASTIYVSGFQLPGGGE